METCSLSTKLKGCLPSGPRASGQPSFLTACCGPAGLPISSGLFWPLHSSAGIHEGHGFCLAHSPSYGGQVDAIPRRLAHSCLLPSGGSAGEGLCTRSLSPIRDCKSPEVGSRTMSDDHLLGHGDRLPLFEGFPHSGEGRDPVGTDRRISIF